MPFSRNSSNALLRNAALWIRQSSADTLADVGLIANAKLNLKPVNQDGNSGSNTIGFDPTLTIDCQQTAVTDVAAVMTLPQKILKQVVLTAEDERFFFSDFMLSPEGTMDLSGGESKFVLTGHKKMTAASARRIHFAKRTDPSQPAVPATTVAYTNAFGSDCFVTVTGGTVTEIAVDGVDTGEISGMFFVANGHTITLTYTAAPAWVWSGQPGLPLTTVPFSNQLTQDCLVEVSGGTVTVIDVNGTVTGQTSGTFLVLAGQTITLTYTVAPTWVWFAN